MENFIFCAVYNLEIMKISFEGTAFCKKVMQRWIKGNAQFIFLCNPQKSLVNVGFMKNIKKTPSQKK